MLDSRISDRFRLIQTDAESAQKTFGEDVAAGLATDPKRLACRYFYDEEGSQLFEQICELPEYYLTRAEHEILTVKADEIAAGFAEKITMVELGSGSAVKTRLLIEAFLRRQDELLFGPVDISRSALEESSLLLLEDYPNLRVLGVASDYHSGLAWLEDEVEGPKVILWLGSNVGNFELDDAIEFLRHLRETMNQDDRLLMGTDLKKDRGILEAAYDDAQGVTAQFNLNLLKRINIELGGDFDLRLFEHQAVYNDELDRIEMYLVSQLEQEVRVEALDLTVALKSGEAIHTENSHKYSVEGIQELADEAGFKVEHQWFDQKRQFSLSQLHPSRG
jgi:dimethylhistidine N-methyltransferase